MAVSQPLTKNPIVLCGSSEETGRPLHSLKVFSLPHTTPQHQLSLMTLKGLIWTCQFKRLQEKSSVYEASSQGRN